MRSTNDFDSVDKIFQHFSSGQEYKEAFYILIEHFDVTGKTVNHWRRNVERPSYFCAGQATEHFLKCYLDLHEIKYPENWEGHNLSLLVSKDNRIKTFFDLNDDDLNAIETLNRRYHISPEYGKNELRYTTSPGTRKSPHPDFFNAVLNKFEKKLSPLFPLKFI